MSQPKNGSKPKRRVRRRGPHDGKRRAELAKHQQNAGLLLRACVWLVQNSAEVSGQMREHGRAFVPLGALHQDVDVELSIDTNLGALVILPAPIVEEREEELTVQMVKDLVSLGGLWVTESDIEAWTPEQREEAAKWGAAMHGGAMVEEPPFPNLPALPAHMAELPQVLGYDLDGKGGAHVSVRYPDGHVEVFEKDIPR